MAKRVKKKAKKKPKKRAQTRPSFKAIGAMLLEKRNTILDEITHGTRKLRVPERRADPADTASETADGAVGLELYKSGSSELAQIEAALRKIEERTYGTCAICGEAIPIARLRALPFATTCIKCKEKQELIDRADAGGATPWPAADGTGTEER